MVIDDAAALSAEELTEPSLPRLTDEAMRSLEAGYRPHGSARSAGRAARYRDRAAEPPAAPFSLPLPDEDEAGLGDDFDADIAAIFGEEATELLEQAEAAFVRWRADRADRAQVTELKRLLHTLKGGARMAGIRAMGDLSHEVESFLDAIESGTSAGDAAALDVLQSSLDELHRMREMANSGQRLPSARDLILRIRALAAVPATGTATEPVAAPATTAAPAEFTDAEILATEAAEAVVDEPFTAIEQPVEEIVLETPPLEETPIEASEAPEEATVERDG